MGTVRHCAHAWRVEFETGTFCFTDGEKGDNVGGYEKLLIFGCSESGRKQAKYMFEDKVQERRELDRRGRDRSDYRRDDRRRSRSRSRDRRDDRRRY